MKTKSQFCQAMFACSANSLAKLRMVHGPAGLGIYMCVLEALFDEPDAILPRDYDVIAFRFGLSAETVRSVIEDFQLFEISPDGTSFYSKLLKEQRRPKSAPRSRSAKSPQLPSTEPKSEPEPETILLPQVCKDPAVQSLPPLTYNQHVALELDRFYSLSSKEQVDLLRNDDEWMRYTAADYEISREDLLTYLQMYEDHCIERKEVHYTITDLRYRFVMWYGDIERSRRAQQGD